MLHQEQRCHLVNQARAAAARAFLTSPGGTAYGAAVLTTLDNVYQAGQYSSFNHVTNVHAEQIALIMATMAGDPDVLALAVASTGSEPVTRPCGVCRQVLVEHAVRIGRDFEIVMARRRDDGYETALLSELLPLGWSPGQAPSAKQQIDIRYKQVSRENVLDEETLQLGDQVRLHDGSVAMVWDGEFEPGGTLVKLKYAPSDGGLRKVAHSFTEPLRYQKELHDLGWSRSARCGIPALVTHASEFSGVFRALQLGKEIDEPPGPLMSLLSDSGVDITAIRVAGSRAIGLQRAGSDWDLVVPVELSRLPSIRHTLVSAIEQGILSIPPQSGTWKLLDRIFPGGREALLESRRYADTLLSGGASVALIFVPPQSMGVCIDPGWIASGRTVLHGNVLQARADYKRAEYDLQDAEGVISVTCYHKAANLLRAGDRISVSGWLLRRGAERRLIQLLPEPDRILWWDVAPAHFDQGDVP